MFLDKKFNYFFLLIIGIFFLNIESPIFAQPINEKFGFINPPIVKNLRFYEDSSNNLNQQDINLIDKMGFMQQVDSRRSRSNFGVTKSTYWLKLDLKAEPGTSIIKYLEIAYPPLDDIRIYLTDGNNAQIANFYGGDSIPFSKRIMNHRNHIFPLDFSNYKNISVLIRVVSNGPLNVPVRIWEPYELLLKDQIEYSILFFFFGLVIALSIYNFFLFLSIKNINYLFYVFLILSVGLTQASLSGIGHQYFWKESIWWSNYSSLILMSLSLSFGIAFARSFLSTKKVSPIIDRILIFLLGLALTNIFFTVFLSYYYGGIIITFLVLLIIPIICLAAVISFIHKEPSSLYFIVAWPIFLLSVIVLALHNNGYIESNFLTVNSLLIGSMIEMLLLSFGISNNIILIRKAKDIAEREVMKSKAIVLHQLEESEKVLDEKVKLRTKDLNQLITLLENKKCELEKISITDPLTKLKNRFKIENEILELLDQNRHNAKLKVSIILLDLDDFKKVNDNYGHLIGDSLLIEISKLLTELIPENCSVGRWGGEEFLIICKYFSITEALNLAESIRFTIDLKQFNTVIHKSASFGVVEVLNSEDSYSEIFSRVDRCLYEAKRNGKNCIVYELNEKFQLYNFNESELIIPFP